jgi:bifunctional autolysin
MSEEKNTQDSNEDVNSPGADEKESQSEKSSSEDNKSSNKSESSSSRSESKSSRKSEELNDDGNERQLRNEIRDLRDENAKHRNRNKELKKESQQAIDDVNKRIQKLEHNLTSFHQQTINAELKAEAVNAGVHSFDDFKKIADVSSLSVSEDGEVKGVKELIKSLKDSKPYLFDTRVTKNTSNSHIQPSPNSESKRDAVALRKANPAEYEKEKRNLIRNYK